MSKNLLFAKLDLHLPDDPKIVEAGDLAELLYVRCILRARLHLTDGVIDRRVLPRWAAGIRGKATAHAAALVRVGLWEECPEGWRFPTDVWLGWNPTAADIVAGRASAAERKREWRERRKAKDRDADVPPMSHGTRDAMSGTATRCPTPTETETETETEISLSAAAADAYNGSPSVVNLTDALAGVRAAAARGHR